ncbi:MAG: O-antigen ligase family protein [Anaerolineales bacterium]
MKPTTWKYLGQEAALLLLFAYVLLFGGGFPALVDFRLQLFSTLLAIAVLGGWLVARVLSKGRLIASGIEAALFLFVLAQFVAVILSEDPRRSLPHAVTWLTYLLIFMFVVDLLRRGWPAELVEKCLLIAGALSLAFAALELGSLYLSWKEVIAGLEFAPTFQQRLTGILGDPNLLAAFVNLLIPLALARALVAGKAARGLLLGFIAVALAVVYFTDSRGGLLGLGTGLAALAVLWVLVVSEPAKRKVRKAWVVLRSKRWLLAALAGGLLLVVGFVAWRTISFQGDTTHAPALEARDIYWQAAGNAFLKDPMTGAGPGMYPVYLMQIWSTPPARPYLHAHSFPFQVAAESGLIGIGALMFLFLMIGKRALAGWRGLDMPSRARRAAVFAALAGLAEHSLVDDFFPFAAVGITTMVLLAMAEPAAIARKRQKSIRPVWLLAGGAAAAGFTLFALLAYWHADQAVVASNAGDWQKAAIEMEAAAKADSGFAFYWLEAGYANARLAEEDSLFADEGIGHYETATLTEPHYALLQANLAALLWQAGEQAPALEEMRIATRLAPEAWLFWLNRGVYEEQLGQTKGAAASYAQALAAESELADSVFWQETEIRQQALNEVVHTPVTGPRAESLAKVAEARDQIAAGDYAGAKSALLEAYALNDQEVRVYVAMGELAYAQGQLDKAERYVQAALWIQATSNQYKVEAILLGAETANASGDSQLALKRYKAGFDAILADASYGWGSAGWSPYAWFVFQRVAFAEDIVPQLERADISADVAIRLLVLAELYEEQGLVHEAETVRESLQPFLPK